MTDKFLPGRHAIEKFGDGGFRFGGMSHRGSILILPSGMRALDAKELADVSLQQLQGLSAEKSAIDFLLIGTGQDMLPLPKLLRDWLSAEKINVEAMNTNAAVRTYNTLLAEDRRIAAVLIAVGRVYG